MEQKLLELFNQVGITNYTFIISIATVIFSMIYNVFLSLTNYIDKRARYWFDKRKELKKNGS